MATCQLGTAPCRQERVEDRGPRGLRLDRSRHAEIVVGPVGTRLDQHHRRQTGLGEPVAERPHALHELLVVMGVHAVEGAHRQHHRTARIHIKTAEQIAAAACRPGSDPWSTKAVSNDSRAPTPA